MSTPAWDAQLRPRLTPYFACAAAVAIVAVHITFGILLKVGTSGVIFRTADQVAFGLLGVVLASLVLLLTRPRLRIGSSGLSVRNVLADRLVSWDDVVDVSFPAGARWARVELADDEYIPVLAIQAVDKGRAVQAMDTVRELMAKYHGSPTAD